MTRQVLLDTGPLVAFLDKAERHHAWSVRQFREIAPPLLTCEGVIVEACFLLQTLPSAIQQVRTYLETRIIQLDFVLSPHIGRVFDLLHTYRNLPMSLADACLVCMAEEKEQSRVLTLDSDFKIYRQRGRMPIPLLLPEQT